MNNHLRIQGDFFKRLKRVNDGAFKRQITEQAGVIAVNFSKQRFIDKNWKDNTSENWDPRKREDRGSLLLKTGRLKRSIRKLYSGNYFVMIGTDVPYAEIHNEGGKINKIVQIKAHNRRSRKGRKTKVVAHSRHMNLTIEPRQFIGESQYLNNKIERYLKLITIKTLKK